MTIERFVAAIQTKDAAGVRASLASTFTGRANGRPLDLDGQVAILDSFFAGFSDGAFKLEATGGSGRHVITWTFAGTHDGIYLGIPATGKPFALSGYIVAHSSPAGILFLEWKWDTKKFMQTVMDPEMAFAAPRPDPVRNWGDGRPQNRRGRSDGRKGGDRKPRNGKPREPRQPREPGAADPNAPNPSGKAGQAAPAGASDAPQQPRQPRERRQRKPRDAAATDGAPANTPPAESAASDSPPAPVPDKPAET
ncbi:MAG: ester cyclase [Candidatus Thermoplasmatota archaeon]